MIAGCAGQAPVRGIDREILSPAFALDLLIFGKALDGHCRQGAGFAVLHDGLGCPGVAAVLRIRAVKAAEAHLCEAQPLEKRCAGAILLPVHRGCRQLHGQEGQLVVLRRRILQKPGIRTVVVVLKPFSRTNGGIPLHGAGVFFRRCRVLRQRRGRQGSRDQQGRQQDRQPMFHFICLLHMLSPVSHCPYPHPSPECLR